ncbi:hypothetical protein X777_09280 [Ooceraea biroi]|uniref:Uncharacterized protein n=1 Tax=Ooceraea biroi TaxID=2015173 RepID=A0A026W7D2_OOCBI|nr:hypothetical protein X777_09280 [Ooceraea biroi]
MLVGARVAGKRIKTMFVTMTAISMDKGVPDDLMWAIRPWCYSFGSKIEQVRIV